MTAEAGTAIEVQQTAGALQEARTGPAGVQPGEEAVLELRPVHTAGTGEVQHHEQHHHRQRGPPLEEGVETDADPDHPGRVEPAQRPDPGQVVVHHMEDRPCGENSDHAHRQGHTHPDQHPDPHGQRRTRRADHRDAAVGTDAERDQQEEQALTGGIALARGGEVRDGQGDALLCGHALEDLLGRHRRGVRVGLGDQEFGVAGVGEEGADQVPVQQSLFGGGPVRQRAHVQRVSRPALHRSGQRPRLRGDADNGDLQMVRLGLVEGALVRERHAEAHQQRGEQVERQVLERVPHGGRCGCGPGCAHEVRSVLRRSPVKGGHERW